METRHRELFASTRRAMGCVMALLLALAGCEQAPADAPRAIAAPADPLEQYAAEVVDFLPGEGGGFGAESLPQIVLGPPQGNGPTAGGMDVLSLGVGGEIILGFGPWVIANGPGVDFVVFENAFWASASSDAVFAELAEVSASEDGMTWHTWACDPGGTADATWPGCAGWTPTEGYDPEMRPLEPSVTGGDAFDLAALGLSHARYIRIRDLGEDAAPPTAGFDLDAVGLVYQVGADTLP